MDTTFSNPLSCSAQRLSPSAAREAEITDAELVRAGQAGDRAALERLLSRHQRSLYLLCRGILPNAEDAEDAVQEAFLRALRALPRFRQEAGARTWLTRIALNVCLEWKRARRRAEAKNEASAREAAWVASPAAEAVGQVYVMQALATLQPRPRALLLRKELEEWSVAEIAQAMRCTERRVYHELRIAHCALTEWQRATEGE